jgi:putative endonuclease
MSDGDPSAGAAGDDGGAERAAGPSGFDRVDGVPVPAADHYVYVLECADGSLYTGYTTDVARRVAEHDAGEGAKYTRGRTPVELVHVEAFDSKSAAMSREYAIKQRSRREKQRLVG